MIRYYFTLPLWRLFGRLFAVINFTLKSSLALAGAPFVADDPNTPPRGGFEFDLTSQYNQSRTTSRGAVASLEGDFGLTTRLQLHAIAPVAFVHPRGMATQTGIGDVELGAKYRFYETGDEPGAPAAAFYPLIQLPSGDSSRGLGAGRKRVFLPVWLGAGWEPWEVFGGGGYWINSGGGTRDTWFAGVGGIRRWDESLTLGAEVTDMTADKAGARAITAVDMDVIYDLAEHSHLLLSVGYGIVTSADSNRLSVTTGYQLTF